MTRPDPDVSRYLEIPVSERPLVRRLAEWRILIPFAGRALALQGSHPTIAKGIYDHSTVFVDPIGRAARTLDYLQRTLFGADQAATAAEIRELHRGIKGIGFDGKPYHAWNREAWTWVYLTTFEAMIYALRTIHGPIPTDQIEHLYQQTRSLGALYNIRARDMPRDTKAFQTYIREGIETKLTHKIDRDLYRNLTKPQGIPCPTALWWPVWRLSYHPLRIVICGSFPSTVRQRWGIQWTRGHEAEYQAQLVVLRSVPASLPERLRTLPYAYRALHPAA
jgi:uncharacterized protein (DUF2236 family)